MPRLHQPVAGTFGGDRLAVQLTREPDGELADVDHLLHLAEGFRGDLPCLDGDQRGDVVLVLLEQLTEPGDQRATHRCGGRAPCRERLRGFGYGGVGLLRSGLRDGEQHIAGDGCAGVHAVGAWLTEFHPRADRLQCVAGLVAKGFRLWKAGRSL